MHCGNTAFRAWSCDLYSWNQPHLQPSHVLNLRPRFAITLPDHSPLVIADLPQMGNVRVLVIISAGN